MITGKQAFAQGDDYHCQDCGKSYKAYESLCRHRRVHRKGTSHICKVCKAQFLRKDILHRHEKIHRRGTLNNDHSNDEDQAGPSQRIRVSRSCDQCSKRKIRCTGGDGGGNALPNEVCSQCQTSRVTCTYLRKTARASVSLALQSAQQDAESTIQEQSQMNVSDSDEYQISNLTEQDQEVQRSVHSDLDTVQLDIAAALSSFATPTNDRREEVAPSYSTPSRFLQEQGEPQSSVMGNLQSDISNDAHCWNWILDEFIPPSPQMISSRASPSLLNPSRQEMNKAAAAATLTQVNNNVSDSDLISSQAVDWELRQSCVFLVVHNCTSSSFHSGGETTENLMRREGERVASIFPIDHPPEVRLFDWLLNLFFEHFHPLWPTFPTGYFDRSSCHPELFLTLAIIGAHYGGEQASLFGRMAHEVLRGSLITNNLDLRSKNPSSEAICQVLMLNKATALYFGQRRAFFIAQQLGALCLVHARRLGLFGSLGLAYDGAVNSGVSQRSEVRKEARRRLAFGIMRLDVYLSLLLGQKPTLSWEEMRLQPLADWSWGTTTSSSHEHGSAGVIFSDLVSLYLHGDESPPILRPVDLELVLMGLVAEGKRMLAIVLLVGRT